MLQEILPALIQSGAVGIIAYLLLQANREQAREHRDEYKALILQLQTNNEILHRRAIERITANTLANTATAERLASLEATVHTHFSHHQSPVKDGKCGKRERLPLE